MLFPTAEVIHSPDWFLPKTHCLPQNCQNPNIRVANKPLLYKTNPVVAGLKIYVYAAQTELQWSDVWSSSCFTGLCMSLWRTSCDYFPTICVLIDFPYESLLHSLNIQNSSFHWKILTQPSISILAGLQNHEEGILPNCKLKASTHAWRRGAGARLPSAGAPRTGLYLAETFVHGRQIKRTKPRYRSELDIMDMRL